MPYFVGLTIWHSRRVRFSGGRCDADPADCVTAPHSDGGTGLSRTGDWCGLDHAGVVQPFQGFRINAAQAGQHLVGVFAE